MDDSSSVLALEARGIINDTHTAGSSSPEPDPIRFAPTAEDLGILAHTTFMGYVVTVTPDVARKWLEANSQNRSIRTAHVSALARDITENRWKITHQGVAFSTGGRLIDGQHRLNAIIEANKPATLTVFIGLNDDMFGALDRGKSRTARDELRLDGRFVDPCSYLANLLIPSRAFRASPDEIKLVMDTYERELLDIIDAAASNVKGRSAAGIRAALMIRLKQTSRHDREFLLGQWKAFLRLDIRAMDDTTAAMLRRLDNTGSGSGTTAANEKAAVSWIGWNPTERDKSKIIVHDTSGVLAEICSIVRDDVKQYLLLNPHRSTGAEQE